MILSIITAIIVYVAGVYTMVALLEPSEFREDLTPVATAAEAFMHWLPGETGVVLVVIAAVAACRYHVSFSLAMARDKLIDDWFSKMGAMGTPVYAIIDTAILMIFF